MIRGHGNRGIRGLDLRYGYDDNDNENKHSITHSHNSVPTKQPCMYVV